MSEDIKKCIARIESTYAEKGIDEASKETREYTEARVLDLFHALAQYCFRTGDAKGMLQAIAQETNPEPIYHMAMQVLNAESFIADKHTRLHYTLQILSPYCDSIPGISDFKARVYGELVGNSFNREVLDHAYRLMRCRTDAQRLSLMAEIYRATIRPEAPALSRHPDPSGGGYGVSAVMRGVMRADAETQTSLEQ